MVLHGRNARINNNGLTASRPNALSEFNDAIIMSNRPLRDGELFEIVIERMVERWSGCIEGMPILHLQQRARKGAIRCSLFAVAVLVVAWLLSYCLHKTACKLSGPAY